MQETMCLCDAVNAMRELECTERSLKQSRFGTGGVKMANEKRLIDANALKAHINGVSTHWLNDWSTLGVLAAVDKQPTVEAVEVVRCKDCKHYKKDSLSCAMNNKDRGEWFNWYDADFCSYGERREGE